MVGILDLPPELHCEIIKNLEPVSRHFLSLAHRQFHLLIGRVNLSRSETFDVNLGREQADPKRYYRLCSVCLRLRQFFHFSLAQASAKTKPKQRTCLDCSLDSYNPKNPQIVKWYLGTTISVCGRCRRYIMCHHETDPSSRSHPFSPFVSRHHCSLPNDPYEPIPDDKYLYVKHIRSELEELEKRLPAQALIAIRPNDVLYISETRSGARRWKDFLDR